MKKLDFSILTEIRNHPLSKGIITDIVLPKEKEYIFRDGVYLRTYLERCLVKNGTYDSYTIKQIINAFIGYLEAPLIFDSFTNHNERRLWQKKLGKENLEYREIVKRNRLSRSMILNVLSMFDVILNENDRNCILENGMSKQLLDQIKNQLRTHKVLDDVVLDAHRIVLCSTTVLFVRNVIVRMMELYKEIPEGVAL